MRKIRRGFAFWILIFIVSGYALATSKGRHPGSHSSSYRSHSYRPHSYSSHRAHTYTGSSPPRVSHRSYRPSTQRRSTRTYSHSTRTSTYRHRSHGRIRRSAAARNAFKHGHPCPSTGRRSGACPGYIIDHVRPLECGGADAPSNMQWQTVAAAKTKDKTERYCR